MSTSKRHKAKNMKPHVDYWKTLQGWCSDEEGASLQRLATDGLILEVGCWKGKSTCAMAATAKHVISIDGFEGDNFAGPHDTSVQAKFNVEGFNITLLTLPWEEVIHLFDLSAFDLIYYDADHTYEATRNFLQRCPESVPLAVHDYDDNPNHAGCKKAVHELNRKIEVFDRLAVMQ